MAFMGELADIGVADLLQLLELRRHTGKLTVGANGEEIVLYVEDGRLVFVTSSNLALRLGRMLLRLGLVTAEQLGQALQEQEVAGSDRSLGRILVDRGWLSITDLARCVEEQCVHGLAQIITAANGVFVWTGNVTVPRRVEAIPLNANRILLEAFRRTDELATLSGLLPPANAPLLLCGWIDDAAKTLNEVESQVAQALRSTAGSLAELKQQLAIDELLVCRTVIGMRERGLIFAGQEPRPELAPAGPGPVLRAHTGPFNGR